MDVCRDQDFLVALQLQLALIEESEQSKQFQKLPAESDYVQATTSWKSTLLLQMQAMRDFLLATIVGERAESPTGDVPETELANLSMNANCTDDFTECDCGKHGNQGPSRTTHTNSKAPIVLKSSLLNQLTCKVECVCCGKQSIKNTFTCSHSYCRECLVSIYENCLLDRSLIPARCCKQPFPSELMPEILNREQQSRYLEFEESKNSFAKNKDLTQVVIKEGWQQCKKCGSAIEKKDGCNHITCYCEHQFCYVCGKDWIPRHCSCQLFGALELEYMLNDIAPEAGIDERNRLREVYRHHDVHNHNWVRIEYHGGRMVKCPNCAWICNKWSFNCSGCRANSCSRCRYNRL